MSPILAYLVHLVVGLTMLGAFFTIYTRLTPYHEIDLIRQGNQAAAYSLAGAMLGFGLTVVSAILHNTKLIDFVFWSAGALFVQLLAYALCARMIPGIQDAIEEGNVAVGMAIGATGLSFGVINAACLS